MAAQIEYLKLTLMIEKNQVILPHGYYMMKVSKICYNLKSQESPILTILKILAKKAEI